jgi:hypothetical protein
VLGSTLCSLVLATGFRGETFDRALYSVVLAIGLHGIDLVVIRCARLEIVHADAESGIGMARVQPDGRFRCLAKVLGIRTVMHDSVMLGRAPGVVACPSDNRKVRQSVPSRALW